MTYGEVRSLNWREFQQHYNRLPWWQRWVKISEGTFNRWHAATITKVATKRAGWGEGPLDPNWLQELLKELFGDLNIGGGWQKFLLQLVVQILMAFLQGQFATPKYSMSATAFQGQVDAWAREADSH